MTTAKPTPHAGFATWLDWAVEQSTPGFRDDTYARAELAALRARVRELEVALMTYGQHFDGFNREERRCLSKEYGPGRCDCGLDAALAGAGTGTNKETEAWSGTGSSPSDSERSPSDGGSDLIPDGTEASTPTMKSKDVDPPPPAAGRWCENCGERIVNDCPRCSSSGRKQ